MSDRRLITFCGVMLALNAISCDILLPTLFALETRFGATRAAVQAVVPIYLMAAAAGQIVFGPLSDRFGRRPIMMISIALYMAGSLAALMASSLDLLYGARGLQGFGAAGMIVLARAILRDTYSGAELARAMALAMAIFTIGPLCAPLLGFVFLHFGGWRGPFVMLTAVGVGLMLVTLLFYRETNARLDARALEPNRLLAATRRLFGNMQSRQFLVVLTLNQMIIVLLVTNAAQLFKSQFGIEGFAFAAIFAFGAFGIVIGQLLNRRLIERIGVLQVTRGAALVVLATAVLTALLVGRMSPVLFVSLLFLFNMSILVVMANSISMVLEPHKDIAGTASAVLGCTTQLIGSAAALKVLGWLDGTMRMWSLVHVALILTLTVVVWSYRPRELAAVSPVQRS